MAVPQDLYAAMVDHQGACNAMLSIKDTVISKMRDVLSKKEMEHVRTLKLHAEVRHSMIPALCPSDVCLVSRIVKRGKAMMFGRMWTMCWGG